MIDPDFTIITINYNNAGGLNKTIPSVQRVLCSRVEWIIVDGGSKDASLDIIKNSSGVTKYISEADRGIYDAMNKGIELASGKYIIFMNSGDAFHWDFNFSLLPVELDDNTVFYGATLRHVDQLLYLDNPSDQSVLWWTKSTLCHQSVFLPRSFLVENNFDITFKYYADAKNMIAAFNLLPNHMKIPSCISIYEVGGISSKSEENLSAWLKKNKEKALAYNRTWRLLSSDAIKGIVKYYMMSVLTSNRYYILSYAIKAFLKANQK